MTIDIAEEYGSTPQDRLFEQPNFRKALSLHWQTICPARNASGRTRSARSSRSLNAQLTTTPCTDKSNPATANGCDRVASVMGQPCLSITWRTLV